MENIYSNAVNINDNITHIEVFKTFNSSLNAHTFIVDVFGVVEHYKEYPSENMALEIAKAYVNRALRATRKLEQS